MFSRGLATFPDPFILWFSALLRNHSICAFTKFPADLIHALWLSTDNMVNTLQSSCGITPTPHLQEVLVYHEHSLTFTSLPIC